MAENSERNTPILSKRAKIIGSAALAAAAALSFVGIEKSRSHDNPIQEPTREATIKHENKSDKILSPEETDAKIQEFITKIDSAYSGIQVEKPTEFPNTEIIRSDESNDHGENTIPAEFKSAIADEDYLSADGIKKLAENCNATLKPIDVRGTTISDGFIIRYIKQDCAAVAFGVGLLAKQTDSPQAKALLTEWQPIHNSIIAAYTTKEPPTNPQPEIDEINQKYYSILQEN